MSKEADEDFVSFVRARAVALVRSTTLLVGDLHVAEDLVQTALERACRKWDTVRRTDAPEAYVRKIVVNLANDRWSRMKRRPEVAVFDDVAVAIDAYGRIDLRDQLMRALFTLPIGMRTVLVLRYFDGLADNQIAELLGINATSVRSQVARGLAKLREQLHGQENVIRVQFGGAA